MGPRRALSPAGRAGLARLALRQTTAVDKVAIVTGANTGIGWAIAQRLQQDGYVLGFHTRNREEETKARFEEIAENGRAHWLVGDLSDRDIGERLVSETVDALGRIDVLVNKRRCHVGQARARARRRGLRQPLLGGRARRLPHVERGGQADA